MTDTETTKPTRLDGGEFPVIDLNAALPELRRPFTAEAIRWKVQASMPPRALIVPYIDARLVYERLNLVVGAAWDATYEEVDGGKFAWCELEVFGVTRRDVGQQMMNMKGLVSDAVKRAAIPFGVGTSLYVIPKIILAQGDGHLRQWEKNGKSGMAFDYDGRGEARCREVYTEWLNGHGIAAFGEPLSHGDVAGAVGDVEAEESSEAAAGGGSEALEGPAEGEEAEALRNEIVKLKATLHKSAAGKQKFPPNQYRIEFQEATVSVEKLTAFRDKIKGLVDELEAETEAKS